MILVALLGFASHASLDSESPLLARDLGVSAYDARLLLAAGFPAIVLSAHDRERALQLAVALRGRGHDVVAVDASAIASSSAMHALREFRIDAGALVSLHPRTEAGGAELPFDDLACILRASHSRRVDENGEVTTRSFDATRAIVSGGFVMTKKTTHSVSSKSEAREEVL